MPIDTSFEEREDVVLGLIALGFSAADARNQTNHETMVATWTRGDVTPPTLEELRAARLSRMVPTWDDYRIARDRLFSGWNGTLAGMKAFGFTPVIEADAEIKATYQDLLNAPSNPDLTPAQGIELLVAADAQLRLITKRP
jgi:hypothetical protein